MQTRQTLAALAIIATIVLSACAPAATPTVTPMPTPTATPVPAAPLDGTIWILSSLGGQPPLTGATVTLAFEAGKASGSDGCNRYGAGYTSTPGKLAVDKNVISTKMACAGPIMQQGQAYISAVTGATAYSSDGKTLTLLDAAGRELAVFAAQSQSLGGTSWVATGYHNGQQAVVSVLNGTSLTLEFKADGSLGGKAGCNGYGGNYEATGKDLKIGRIIQTLMACATPAGIMEQESRFLRALESAATFRIEGDTLEIRRSDGATAATFTKSK